MSIDYVSDRISLTRYLQWTITTVGDRGGPFVVDTEDVGWIVVRTTCRLLDFVWYLRVELEGGCSSRSIVPSQTVYTEVTGSQ